MKMVAGSTAVGRIEDLLVNMEYRKDRTSPGFKPGRRIYGLPPAATLSRKVYGPCGFFLLFRRSHCTLLTKRVMSLPATGIVGSISVLCKYPMERSAFTP
ncbi:hypothetical protein MTO96_026576 [Rhipicephalus appendiculatus]